MTKKIVEKSKKSIFTNICMIIYSLSSVLMYIIFDSHYNLWSRSVIITSILQMRKQNPLKWLDQNYTAFEW